MAIWDCFDDDKKVKVESDIDCVDDVKAVDWLGDNVVIRSESRVMIWQFN